MPALCRPRTQSSIGGIPKRQFKEILRYDLIVAVNPGENQAEQDKLKKLLADDSIADYQEIHSETLTERIQRKKENRVSHFNGYGQGKF